MSLIKCYKNRVEFIDTVIKTTSITVLDIGAGGLSPNIPESYRPMSRYIFKTIGETRYTGIEHDPEKVARLKEKFGVSNVQVADIQKFRSDKTFDLIYCGLTLQYIYDFHSALTNIKASLKLTGLFIFDVPNSLHYRNLTRYLLKSRTRLDLDPYHWHNETIVSMSKKLQRVGFEILESAYIGGNHDFLIPWKYREFIGFKAKIKPQASL